MSGQRVVRGVGAFVLFFVLYLIIAGVITGVALYFLDNRVVHWLIDYFSGNENIYDNLLELVARVFGALFGVQPAIAAQTAILKKRPTRGVGVAWILFVATQYALHFIYFPEMTDWTIYSGLIQCAVSTVVVWVEFRLPPLMPRHDQVDDSMHPSRGRVEPRCSDPPLFRKSGDESRSYPRAELRVSDHPFPIEWLQADRR